MPHPGQEIEGFGGMRLRLIQTGDETDGELLEMEARYTGEAGMPPAHLHPNQVERFEVLDGSMRTIIDGEERLYEAGESFEVPAGTLHQMAAEGPARTRWEVRPALRTAEFFERLFGSGPDSAQRDRRALLRGVRGGIPPRRRLAALQDLLGHSKRPVERALPQTAGPVAGQLPAALIRVPTLEYRGAKSGKVELPLVGVARPLDLGPSGR